MILQADDQQQPGAREALEQLCKIYWPPLYAFLRKQGRSPDDAKDLTQGFFVHILYTDGLRNIHPTKGKFRSFLLACLNNYVQNERDKERAEKRGGGQTLLIIDDSEAETGYGIEPEDQTDPAKLYDRRWASTLLSEVLRLLKQKCNQERKSELFDELCPFLTGDAERGVTYADVAGRLRMSEGAVRVAASRLRSEFRELLRSEVGRTVSSQEEVDEELRYLVSISQA